MARAAPRNRWVLWTAPALLACLVPAAVPAQATPLNDTGIVWSGGATGGNATTCDTSHPAGQDCRYGRDALAAAGLLPKVGASTPINGIETGFDYTKIANSGAVLPAGATLGSGPGDWACTRDNVTGLIWEVKTSDGGLRSQDHTYTWYDTNSPDGNPGTAGTTGTCGNTLGSDNCNTENYAAAVNAAGLCGANDWRMPTVYELEGLASLGRYLPAIDTGYFPNPPVGYFWSGSPYAGSSSDAWGVSFSNGYANYSNRANDGGLVRLVRGGQ